MPFLGYLSALLDSQSFARSRREFLQKAVSVTSLFFLPRSQPRPQLFSSCQAPEPEFWFGDNVSFYWIDEDENDGLPYSESGEVVGVAWNQLEEQWEYIVTWLSSTAHPDAHYPIFDNNTVTARELCKP